MSRRTELLSDEQWEKIFPLLPKYEAIGKRGRPRTRPQRVIANKAYDIDTLRKRLRKRGVTLLSPYRKNRKNKRKQDRRMKDR